VVLTQFLLVLVALAVVALLVFLAVIQRDWGLPPLVVAVALRLAHLRQYLQVYQAAQVVEDHLHKPHQALHLAVLEHLGKEMLVDWVHLIMLLIGLVEAAAVLVL
jgi:hypothetical protein